MKVAIECTSPLLQKSLEMFLKPYLSSLKQCDVVLRDYQVDDDNHRSLYIASSDDADIKKPFSEAELKLILHKTLHADEVHESKTLGLADAVKAVSIPPVERSYEQLEAQIEQLTQEYQANILKVIKAFHGA